MANYADPKYHVPMTDDTGALTLNATADSARKRIKKFAKWKLTAAKAVVVEAGLNTDDGFTVYKGTDSIGVITIGTETANSWVDGTITETTFESTDELTLNNVNSATAGQAQISLQWQHAFA